MSYVFRNQISTFYDNCILFCTFFCQGTFYVTILWKFDKIKNFWLFFLWCEGCALSNELIWNFLSVLEKLQPKHKSCFKKSMVMTRCQELVFLSGTRGSKREEKRWKMITGGGAIHKQNRWKCRACETKGAERSPSYCWNDSRWAGYK